MSTEQKSTKPALETVDRVGGPHEAAANDKATGLSVRDGVIIMTIASLILLFFNSDGLRLWARNLPGNAASDVLVNAADDWHELMVQTGFAAPKRVVQQLVTGTQDLEWTEKSQDKSF